MKLKYFLISLLVGVFIITGCQNNQDNNSNKNNNEEVESNNKVASETEEAFPVTVESADKTVEVKEKPERILPLSLDVTEIVLELVDPSKVAAISKSVEDPLLSSHAAIAD